MPSALPSLAQNRLISARASGQPGSGGSYPITITATNQLGTASQAFLLRSTRNPRSPAPTMLPLQPGLRSPSRSPTGFPAPKITEVGALPKGVTFNRSHRNLHRHPQIRHQRHLLNRHHRRLRRLQEVRMPILDRRRSASRDQGCLPYWLPQSFGLRSGQSGPRRAGAESWPEMLSVHGIATGCVLGSPFARRCD
jgi:hypothetical protein